MIEKFGFKNCYHLRQAQIPVDLSSKENIESEIREKIIPAVLELERQGLIDGFYFILHANIDLRLSCDSWEKKEEDIKSVLMGYSISGELTPLEGLIKDDFKNLENNNLEMNSRFMMAFLLLKDQAEPNEQSEMQKKIPTQWIHYMYNQFGILNLHQGLIEFHSGFFQLSEALRLNQCNKAKYIEILEWVKNSAEAKIKELNP